MSMYNLVNGVNQATFFILPMLGKHPDEYPRFRDCFVEDGKIHVYTRAGGGNRESYEEEIEKLQNNQNYISDADDDSDCTYATFVFSIPDKWKNDFNKIINGEIKNISPEYIAEMKKVFPKLEDKFNEIFNIRQTSDNNDCTAPVAEQPTPKSPDGDFVLS